MGHLELHAHLKVRPGQLEGFKAQAAKLIQITKDEDTKTLRYDWFIKDDGTECEVHEAYVNEEGLFEHNKHILEARNVMFRDFAYDHKMTVFGDISQKLKELAVKHAGGIGVYSFLEGLGPAAAV